MMMAYAHAGKVDISDIPVIDLSPLRDGSDPQSVGDALARASSEVGFLYVSGHGISDSLIEGARAAARAYFAQPEAVKLRAAVNRDHRGYIRVGQAFMSDGAKMDLKESFIWGWEGEMAEANPYPLPVPNLWPDDGPDLRQALVPYFQAAEATAKDILSGFALGLGLPRDFFFQHSTRPISRASLTYYPPQPETMGEQQFGVAPHTDYGCLTVLCQDEIGGLQVQTLNGEWIEATPIPGTLVINVGDLLERWTDGRFRSTPHRVINASGRERYSLVMAFDPDYETVIDARDIWSGDATIQTPPTTCGEAIQARLGRSFKYDKS